MIIRNGTEDSGTIQCGGEKLVMKDNDFDELEFLEIRSIPDNHVKIFADEQVQEAIRMFTMQYPPARFARIGNGILIDPNWDWKPDTTARWYFLEEK